MVLPLPPFCDSMTIVFMKSSLSIKHGLLKGNTAGHWWASAVYNLTAECGCFLVLLFFAYAEGWDTMQQDFLLEVSQTSGSRNYFGRVTLGCSRSIRR